MIPLKLDTHLSQLKAHLEQFSRMPEGRRKRVSFEQMKELFERLCTRQEWIDVIGMPGHFSAIRIETFALREVYSKAIGFCILSKELVEALGRLLANQRTIEVGCGTGELAHQLLQHSPSLNYLAFDSQTENNPYGFLCHKCVLKGDGPVELKQREGQYDTVLMSWPCYQQPFAEDVARAMPLGSTLIHCYEEATGTEEFYSYLSETFKVDEDKTAILNQVHLQFPGLHDRWEVRVKRR